MRRITSEMSQWRLQRCSGKNLVDFATHPDFDLQPDGSYKSNATVRTGDTLPITGLEPGTYTLSARIKSPVGKNYRVNIKYTDGTQKSVMSTSTGDYVFSAVTSDPAKTISEVGFTYAGNSNEVYVRDYMLECGNTATEYEPYCGGAGCLGFSRCKGGYFSTFEEYTIKVFGKQSQVGTPRPENPADVQCVKAGTKVRAGSPMTTTTAWINTSNQLAYSSDSYAVRLPIKPSMQYELYLDTSVTTLFRAGATSSEALPVLGAPIALSSVTRTNTPSHITLNADASSKYIWVQISGSQSQEIYNLTVIDKSTSKIYKPFVVSETTLPCDLYDGDVWYPMSGKVELQSIPPITATAWINTTNKLAFSPDSFSARFEVEPSTQYELYLDTDVATLFRAGVTDSEGFPVLEAPIQLSPCVRSNTPSHITLNTDASAKYIWVQISAGQMQEIYNLMAINKNTGEARRLCITTEQYDPQPIFAPQGTVIVTQSPTELAANLSATMLVRR